MRTECQYKHFFSIKIKFKSQSKLLATAKSNLNYVCNYSSIPIDYKGALELLKRIFVVYRNPCIFECVRVTMCVKFSINYV